MEMADVPNSDSKEMTEAAYLGKEEWSTNQKEKKERRSWSSHCMNSHSLNFSRFIFPSGQMAVLGLVC